MKRLVVKVGTAVLTNKERGLDAEYVAGLCAQIVDARRVGWQAVLVSSGAIGAGAPVEDAAVAAHPEAAAAAVGQGCSAALHRSLGALGVTAAQVL